MPIKKGAHESMIYFVTPISPPYMFHLFNKSFLETPSLVTPSPLNKTLMIASIKLLDLNPTILSTQTKICHLVHPSTT
jgi:hypothetical protein